MIEQLLAYMDELRGGALGLVMDNWIMIALCLLVLGFVVDQIVYMVRFRPWKRWMHNLRVARRWLEKRFHTKLPWPPDVVPPDSPAPGKVPPQQDADAPIIVRKSPPQRPASQPRPAPRPRQDDAPTQQKANAPTGTPAPVRIYTPTRERAAASQPPAPAKRPAAPASTPVVAPSRPAAPRPAEPEPYKPIPRPAALRDDIPAYLRAKDAPPPRPPAQRPTSQPRPAPRSPAPDAEPTTERPGEK